LYAIIDAREDTPAAATWVGLWGDSSAENDGNVQQDTCVNP
jgi:hypothetical protein